MRAALLALALLPAAAVAQDVVGPADVWPDFAYGACDFWPEDKALFACLAAAGAPPGTLAFAQRLQDPTLFESVGILTAFAERGRVDAATVELPAFANSNTQVVFVNGAPPVLIAGNIDIPLPTDRASRAILAAHPDANPAGPMVLAGYRDLPDGTQRFVLMDWITDGCRACAVLANSLTHVDFRDGRLVAVTPAGWGPPQEEMAPTAIARRLLAGDAALLQFRLTAAGHDPGGIDGVIGPATRAALGLFLRENGLSGDRLTPAAADLLAGVAPKAAGPLPFDNGTYAADARLCDPASPAWRELGDLAYPQVITIEGDRFGRVEADCVIRAVTTAGDTIGATADCRSEGMTETRRFAFTPLSDTSFREEGRVFTLCAP